MPQGPPKLHAKWGDDGNAARFLESRGYKLQQDWTFLFPPGVDYKSMDSEEYEAVYYLVHEWDYGGLTNVR